MRGLAEILVPHVCASCGRRANGGLCSPCIEALDWIGPHVCRRCGRGAETPSATCEECRYRGFCFDRARAAVSYQSVIRTVIRRYKYGSEHAFAAVLSLILAKAVGRVPPDTVTTWVPSSADRVRLRGFDHGRLLCQSTAAVLGLRSAGLISKQRKTRPQMELEPHERRTNLQGAFQVSVPAPDHVLVIDDVYTTGATASEAARALRAAGALKVWVATVARTPGPARAPRPAPPPL